ncbi:uncharacterized protein Z519_11741 [Cladophialophora bantiana CBS 173.52]|uniref:2,6-dihydroxypyridine 3-monooxygenase substrate binding domain-containing protein n=1 Tax=Cladophialophora bantiana (strain ATCC 10958 / CBS 173.52 / CDC B-1940 / NIH 8579) TaxID=1442370 RepID=A0A0D2FM18_CLAB1|nr:uncharacterized protein Z519_11741 [Cladophialophora bantiana CBS 173.52]KIW87767.1 hypothetical protein Z519_11741 [Cladophialophora bantiana CBS 173.52]
MSDYGIPLNSYNILDTKGVGLRKRSVVRNCAITWIQLFRILMLAFNEESCEKSAICRYRYSCNVQNIISLGEKAEVCVTNDEGQSETLVGDLIIGADGASSKIHSVVLHRRSEHDAMRVMNFSATLCWNLNSQMLSYTVPARKDGPPNSHSFLNWGWYMEKTEDELNELMTDVDGQRHHYALPQGGMRALLADEIRMKAQEELSPQFAEAVAKTKSPFVQIVTDSGGLGNLFSDGKILLVGDAAGGQRPHAGSAVTMACFHAHLLRLLLQGLISLDEWSRETQFVSSALVKAGQELGSICLSTNLDPREKAKSFLGGLLAAQKLLTEKWMQFWKEKK